jgi:hypothetical protein
MAHLGKFLIFFLAKRAGISRECPVFHPKTATAAAGLTYL